MTKHGIILNIWITVVIKMQIQIRLILLIVASLNWIDHVNQVDLPGLCSHLTSGGRTDHSNSSGCHFLHRIYNIFQDIYF